VSDNALQSISGLSASVSAAPIDATSPIETEYRLKVLERVHDEAKLEGHAAVQLIEAARQPPPSGPDGKGAVLNTYA